MGVFPGTAKVGVRHPSLSLIAALGICLLTVRGPGALTIVRVGGQGLAVPQGADLVQLTWQEAAAGDFGSTRLIVFENGAIAPVFASPEENLTPSIRDKGGSVRVSTTAGRLQNEPQIDNLLDGNPATVYEGSAGKRLTEGISSYNALTLYDPGCDCDAEYKVLVFNLGKPYNISRIRFGTRPKHALDRFIPELTVGVAPANPVRPGKSRDCSTGSNSAARPASFPFRSGISNSTSCSRTSRTPDRNST